MPSDETLRQEIVTERKQALAALRESEERYWLLFELASGGALFPDGSASYPSTCHDPGVPRASRQPDERAAGSGQ